MKFAMRETMVRRRISRPRPLLYFNHFINKNAYIVIYKLEIVFTIAAPAFDILFIGCVLNTKIVYTTAEK